MTRFNAFGETKDQPGEKTAIEVVKAKNKERRRMTKNEQRMFASVFASCYWDYVYRRPQAFYNCLNNRIA
jgi:hypothetical protein